MDKATKLKEKAIVIAVIFLFVGLGLISLAGQDDLKSNLGMYLFCAELSKALFMCTIILFGISRYIDYFILEKPNIKYKKDIKYKKYYTYSLISENALLSTLMFISMNFMFKMQRHSYIQFLSIRNAEINNKITKYLNRESSIYFVYLIIALLLVLIFKFMCIYVKHKVARKNRSVK